METWAKLASEEEDELIDLEDLGKTIELEQYDMDYAFM